MIRRSRPKRPEYPPALIAALQAGGSRSSLESLARGGVRARNRSWDGFSFDPAEVQQLFAKEGTTLVVAVGMTYGEWLARFGRSTRSGGHGNA